MRTTALSSHRELLRHVLSALGVGSAIVASSGCGGQTVSGGPLPADASSDLASTPDDASGPDAAPPDLVIVPPIILVPRPDVDWDGGKYCQKLVVSREQGTTNIACPADAGDAGTVDPRYVRVRACLPAPPIGQSCADSYNEACIYNTYNCGLQSRAQFLLCGPLPGPDDQCCYITAGGCPVGRPFLVAGAARIAPVSDEPSWSSSLRPDTNTLDAATRGALADVWTKDGLAEHASVASFSRFVLQCLAVGAPADIVEGAQRACADEVEHARIAFGLASAYAGRPIGPGRLDIAGALDENLDAVDIACCVAGEGCIAELVSASIIAAAGDAARDPVVKTVLARVAEQELGHGLLAWRYLAWAFATGDDRLRARVAQVFDRMHEHVGFGAQTSLPADADQMRAHGYVNAEQRRRIATAVIENVIRPAARALFAGAESARAASCRRVA